jgi:hypothetical protein
MSELPWAKWFWGDYTRDTRVLSCRARGGWVDILGEMHNRRSGQLQYGIEAWARVMGTDQAEAVAIIEEIERYGVANVTHGDNGGITVVCRRLNRQNMDRYMNRLRQTRWRQRRADNAGVTGQCNGAVGGEKPDLPEETPHSPPAAEPPQQPDQNPEASKGQRRVVNGNGKPLTVWELKQKIEAARARIRQLRERHPFPRSDEVNAEIKTLSARLETWEKLLRD